MKNLTTDWPDGIAFHAILHRFCPKLVTDCYSLKSSEKSCKKLFKISVEYLDLPRLFDAEDMVEVLKPDKKSILNYLFQFYLKFTAEETKLKAKNSISNVLKGINYSYEARNT